jgi:hypothetical protein
MSIFQFTPSAPSIGTLNLSAEHFFLFGKFEHENLNVRKTFQVMQEQSATLRAGKVCKQFLSKTFSYA